MKKSLLVGLFTLLFLAYIGLLNYPRETTVCGERYISEDGQYSYILPEDWVNMGYLGDGAFIVNPEIENGIKSNIHISYRNTQREEEIRKISEQIVLKYKDITILNAGKIQTDSGAEGAVIYSQRTNTQDIAVHCSHYILPHQYGVVVVAGTCAALYKDKNDVIFRDAAKSIRDESKP